MRKYLILLALLMIQFTAAAQTLHVSGTVISADDNEPLIGATVKVVENPSLAVSTDLDGRYSIDLRKGQTLEFSYVGCDAVVKKITEPQTLNVALRRISVLDEVVVIGYGTMKKSDLTGSVASVASEQLQKTPAPSLANALQGQAAGVTVNALTGRPGAQAEVRIRGVGTVNSPSPIYVVDGVITDDISFLSPADIASTEILKDASATAIYGSRGANGVIIVTTRTGGADRRARISFDAYAGTQDRWRKLEVMDSQEFQQAYININANQRSREYFEKYGFNKWLQAFKGVGASPYYPTVYDAEKNPTGFDYASQNTDWQDQVFRTAWIQNYHLAIDGSGDRFNYSMSTSWFKQQGTLIGSEYSRLTTRLNTSYKATDWLKVGENISFMAGVAQNAYESGDNTSSPMSNMLSAAFAMAPWDPVRYPEGSVNRLGNDMSGRLSAGSNFTNVTNPFSMLEYNHPHNRTERWVGNVFAEITPLKGLTLRSAYSFDYKIGMNRSFGDAYEVSAFDKREKNFLSRDLNRTYNYTVENILTYANKLGKHDFSIMAGQTTEEYSYYGIGASGSTILNPEARNWYLAQVTDDFSRPSDGVGRSRRLSFLGRLHYSYADRYLATVNFRADGSSKFPEKAWGYFPSFALAWRINQEQFMRDFDKLSNLKLRFGWGKVGNDNIGNNAFLLTMFNSGPTFVDYVLGADQQLANGATVLTWVNNGGHWENTEQLSLGLDFGFLNNSVSGAVDLFVRDTKDMLMSVTAPAHVGNRYSATANVGQVRNKGIELTLNHDGRIGDVSYTLGGNVSFIDNKLTKLNGGSPIYSNYDGVQVVDEGHPLYYYWGYKYDGLYRTDDEANAALPGYAAGANPFHAGDARYVDVNGDGVINQSDRTYLGSAIPWLNYGLNMAMYWNNFDISVFFQGVGGNKIYNQKRHSLEGNGATSVLSPVMANAWTANNPDGTLPNPVNTINYYTSDRFLESGAYLRLKNLQIGWTVPKQWISGAGFQNCRIYVQGGNLATWTKYTGFDPEVSSGVDYGNYPQSRTALVGVNISY